VGVLGAHGVRRLIFVRREHRQSRPWRAVTQSGIDAAKAVLNCRTRDILTQQGSSLTFFAVGGCQCVAGEFENEDGERGDRARGRGDGSVRLVVDLLYLLA